MKWVLKRGLDVTLSLLALVLLAPVFILIAMVIRLTSPGPALFRQPRLGRHGVPFTCLKFRTMYVNAPDIRNHDGSTFNAQNDPRVTAVGRFLRKTTLDELPQFINVLKGDMSVVGPRADPVDAFGLYGELEKKRLEVRPGMTGWAFVHGRNTVPLPRRRELDVEYVEKYSIGLDVQILLRTIPYVLLRKGVYTAPSSTAVAEHVQD